VAAELAEASGFASCCRQQEREPPQSALAPHSSRPVGPNTIPASKGRHSQTLGEAFAGYSMSSESNRLVVQNRAERLAPSR
jgi:hypothetical protein